MPWQRGGRSQLTGWLSGGRIIQDEWWTMFSWRMLLGRAIAVAGHFPQINAILFHFSNLYHVPLFLESESQRLSSSLPRAHTPCSHSAGHGNGGWPQLSHDAHHKHDFPGFGDPNLFRAILIISSFCQGEKLFSQIIPQSHNNFEILFPVFLLTWFATSIPPPPLSTSATPCFPSFLNSISSSHSPTCSYTSVVLSIASWHWKGTGSDIPSVFISHLRVKPMVLGSSHTGHTCNRVEVT